MGTQKLYLSSSNIQVFLGCKRKYKYKYIDRINIGYGVANKHLAFGQSVHIALAKFNMITDNQFRTLENLHTLLRKNWKRDGYETLEEERQFGLKGLEMLSSYFNNPLDQGKETLLTEEMIRKDVDGKFILCGKLDKVYAREDDIIETLDYKTGNSIEPINSWQLPIYILLTGEKLGRYPDIISYYYLSHGHKIEQEATDKIISEVVEYLWSIYEEICQEREFPCSPSLFCVTNCEFFNFCEEAKDNNSIVVNELKKLKDAAPLETVF